MRTFRVRLFTLPPSPPGKGAPAEPPKEQSGFTVDAENDDGARAAITARLKEWGFKVRAVSALVGGGYSATVEAVEGRA